MTKYLFTFTFVALTFLRSMAQTATTDYRNLFPTPNASGLGMFGQIPVDFFTGQPDINIPLFTYKSRDLSVPITINYHSGGMKVADHAGWVGLGWNLQAGGVINRIQNDLPDEYIAYGYADPTTHSVANVMDGFFYNYSLQAGSNWTTSTFLSNLNCRLQQATVISGSCYPQYRKDEAPDEFAFNFLGMSGSLFMGTDGKWYLKSKQALNFTVKVDLGSYTFTETSPPGATIPNSSTYIETCITDIILTAADGTQYTFGGTPTSIEFSRVGTGTLPPTRDGGTVPMSWYLTKMVSPTTDEIDFNYSRDGYQIANYPGGVGYTYNCSACNPSTYYFGGPLATISDRLSILDGITLSSIKGANGTVNFVKSKANVLDFSLLSPYTIPAQSPQTLQLFSGYGYEVFNGLIASGNELYGIQNFVHSTFMKLTKMTVSDNNGNPLMNFGFNYSENANNRLFLTSMIKSSGDYSVNLPYTFSYNNIAGLAGVPYESTKVDHWGYYNNVDPLTGLYFYNGTTNVLYNPLSGYYYVSNYSYVASAFNSSFASTYSSNKSPSASYMQYGVLTSITFPTGGNTQFTWEPNTYSKCINDNPVGNSVNIAIQDLSSTIVGAGLRINKITTTPNTTSPAVVKSYLYDRDYVNNNYLSSGVLNSPQPNYVDSYGSSGNFTYSIWSTNNRVPLQYTNGSPVTYTNVQEINSDGGFTNYTYSNHDNGYQDSLPNRVFAVDEGNTSYEDLFSKSFELERGLLLNEIDYKSGSIMLKNKFYKYNNDPTRYATTVRKYELESKFSISGTVLNFQASVDENPASSGPAIYTGFNYYAFSIYTHYPYLRSDSAINYDQNGANPLTTVNNYSFDGYRNKLSETRINSKGETINNQINYPANTISGLSAAAQTGKNALITAGMFGIPLEKITTNNLIQTDHTLLDYQSYTNTNNTIVPLDTYQASYGYPLESGTQFLNYDSRGNISEYIARDGLPTSFDWGYNQAYPTLKIENAANTLHTYYIPTISTATNYFLWPENNFAMQYATINVLTTGNITLTAGWSESPGSSSFTFPYTLMGPVNESGYLCISATGGCGIYPSTITFANMPVGTYYLSADVNSNYTVSTQLSYTYPTIINTPATAGIKEYFYESFEENPAALTGQAHTGVKYLPTNYPTTFTPPNGRNYLIQWWNFTGTVWVFHQQAYSTGMVLTGPVDDVRIFPSDAKITTYTYNPLVGLSSETDHNGKTDFYEYDPMQRLQNIKDYQGNITKNFQYNYLTSPNANVFTRPMQTFAGTNTISYPVGVFNVNGKLLGNATNQAAYITTWMADTADAHTGTIVAGSDSMHFQFTVNSGRSIPNGLTGCRYYQYDVSDQYLINVTSANGCYIDYGDGEQVRMGNSFIDSADIVLSPNTTKSIYSSNDFNALVYSFDHTYPNANLKTVTIYHDDDNRDPALELSESGGSDGVTNIRGTFPQGMQHYLGEFMFASSAENNANISNWNSIKFITEFGDGINSVFTQDFMDSNVNLTNIEMNDVMPISRLKSNWNTYFTNINSLYFYTGVSYNFENLSGLHFLNDFYYYNSSPSVTTTTPEIDNIINQIAAGGGQYTTNGYIYLTNTVSRSSNSNTSVNFLKSKGWTIQINSVLQ